LARVLAQKTGETITEAVIQSLRERIQRQEGRIAWPSLKEELLAIGHRCAQLPVYDTRSPEEIIGFDEHGIPR